MTTFGLVHGAWHGAWCWQYLAEELDARGFASITPELPIDDAAAGLAEYANTVIDELGDADDVVLVGHSMGSLVVPLVAAARPVRGMVFLCSVPLVPGATVGLDFGKMVTAEVTSAPRFRDETGREMFDNQTACSVFFHDCDDDLAAWAVSRLRPQGSRPFTEPTPLRDWPEAPSEVVLTEDDRAVNSSWAVGAAAGWLGHDPVMLPGSHSPFLSRPAALADVLVELSR